MTPLRVLEASARQGNFTKAAEELGISQPSVSRHIANLEQELGTSLFLRNHNKVRLTEDGRALAKAVDMGLSHILSQVDKIAAPQPAKGLTLACTHSFAHGWLLPRFSSLRQAMQGMPIKLVVSYWLKDVVINEVDLIIGMSGDGWTGWPHIHLFDEIIYPVCAPRYLEENPDVLTLAALPKERLLDFEILDDRQLGWDRWFAEQGLAFEGSEGCNLFSNYHFMIQAAMDGEGIALGWHHLVADQIKQGRLVKVGPALTPPASRYTLEYHPDYATQSDLEPVLDWFRRQMSDLKQQE